MIKFNIIKFKENYKSYLLKFQLIDIFKKKKKKKKKKK